MIAFEIKDCTTLEEAERYADDGECTMQEVIDLWVDLQMWKEKAKITLEEIK